MAQAGAAYHHTASVQPINPRTSQRSAEAKRRSETQRKSGSSAQRKPNEQHRSEQHRSKDGRAAAGHPKPSGTGGVRGTSANGRPRSGSGSAAGNAAPRSPKSDRRHGGAPAAASAPNGRHRSSGAPSAKHPISGRAPHTAAAPHKKPVRNPQFPKRNPADKRRQMVLRMRRREKINRVMLAVAGCLIVAALFVYIGRMAEISKLSKQADTLRLEITKLREDKQYKEVDLAASQNPDRVRDEALRRLGMIEPSADQIRYVPIDQYIK